MIDSDAMYGRYGANMQIAFKYQDKGGFLLVPIRHKTKTPSIKRWSSPEYAFSAGLLSGTDGVGIVHARSGTMAFDIDDWRQSQCLLSRFGLDLEELYNAPDAVTINSGIDNRGKLLYRMPKRLILPKYVDKDSSGKVIHEFRCAGCMDVLPPSIHPSGNPYQWGGLGDWKNLPTIPEELLNIWKESVREQRELILTDKPKKASQIVNYKDIDSALYYIPADCSRDEWIRIGMALHSTEDGLYAFEVWDKWSSQGDKYPGRKHLIGQWNSFKHYTNRRGQGVIALGTLFYIAKGYGYNPPRHLADHLFKDISNDIDQLDGVFDDEPSLFAGVSNVFE